MDNKPLNLADYLGMKHRFRFVGDAPDVYSGWLELTMNWVRKHEKDGAVEEIRVRRPDGCEISIKMR